MQQGAAALRAQTAAAALSNGSGGWGSPSAEQQGGFGIAAGSPSKGVRAGSSGVVGRRGALERPQTVGAADVDSAELAPLPDPEGTLRYMQ
jgi:hypothetical protein